MESCAVVEVKVTLLCWIEQGEKRFVDLHLAALDSFSLFVEHHLTSALISDFCREALDRLRSEEIFDLNEKVFVVFNDGFPDISFIDS